MTNIISFIIDIFLTIFGLFIGIIVLLFAVLLSLPITICRVAWAISTMQIRWVTDD